MDQGTENQMLIEAVSRVFAERKWKTLEDAGNGTGMPPTTIGRLRSGAKVDAGTAMKFADAIGEDQKTWVLCALGLPPDTGQQVDADILEYIKDPDTREWVRYLHGLPKEMRPAAMEALREWQHMQPKYKDASEIAAELEAEATIGSRRRQHRNPD